MNCTANHQVGSDAECTCGGTLEALFAGPVGSITKTENQKSEPAIMLQNLSEIIAQDESNKKALSDELIQELRAPSNAFNQESPVSLQRSEDSIKAIEKENTIQRLRAENDALLQEMDIMVKDKQSLTKERDHATAEHADLLKQVGVWSEELESFTQLQQAKDKELDVLRQRLALMETRKNAPDKSRRQAETQLQESQQNIKALMDENKKMKGVVDAQQKKIEMLLAASQQDKKEKEKCIADKETLTKERDVVKKAHAELVKQLVIWTQEFEVVRELQAAGDKHAAELYRQLNCCKEELTRCQRDLVQATSEKHTSKNELTAEIDALRQRLVMMEEHTYCMVQSLGEAETRLAASKVENGEKENRIGELTMEHDTLRGLMEEQNNKSLEEARAMALSRLEESEQTVLMKENCIQALMDLNKEMNSVLVSLQRECEMVLAMSKQDNMEKEKRIRELTVELENARGNAKDLTAELHEFKAEVNVLQQRLVMMEEHTYSMVQSLGEAEMRLAASKEAFHQRMALMEEHIKEMKTIVDAQQQEIAMSMKDMKKAWTLHEKSRQDYKDVIKKEEMRTELIQDLMAEAGALRQEMDIMRAEAGALRQEMDIMVKNKISEVETLKAELEASNGEVQVVQKEHVKSQRACMDIRKMLEDKEAVHAKHRRCLLDKFASRLLRKTVADEFHMWRELAQAGVYDRKMGAKDQEASELHTELSCCKEELTRCQSDLAQATSENQLIHTAKNNLTAELHALQERVHLIEEQNSFLVRSLRQEIDAVNGSLDAVNGSLAASKQSILMKDQSIKSLVDEMKVMKSVVDAQQKEIEMVRAVSQQANMEKEKCLEELMFEKKMTAELDVLRERIVLMQGHNDAMVDAIGEAETKLVAAKLENMEKRKLIKELTFEINGLLAEAEKSLVDSRQTVLMKENCITALMAEEEKCNKELMFDEKMTAELDALRGRMGLMQWSNDALVEFLREAETKLVESKPENMEKKSA